MHTELAWAAGFFDGEGCTTLELATNKKSRTKPWLKVTQKESECLLRFNAAIGGIGKVWKAKANGNRQYCHYLTIKNATGVDTVLTALWPYLSSQKRQQAERNGFRMGVIRDPRKGPRPYVRQNLGLSIS